MPGLVVVLVCLLPGLRPWPPPDARAAALAREACERNRAGIAAVRTLSCRCTETWLGRTPDADDPGDFHEPAEDWEYWLAGDAVRIRGQAEGGPDDTVWHFDPPLRQMYVRTDADGTRTLCIVPGLFPPRQDARFACLFMLWEAADLYRGGDWTLAGLLGGPCELWAARRVSEEGIESVYLDMAVSDLALSGRRVRAWLDPARNYLVWKVVVTTARPRLTDEYRVTEFRQAADGAFIPIRVEHRMSGPGAAPATRVTTLSDVRINEPVPAEQLRIPGLAGLKCVDMTRLADYRVDENGDWSGPWDPDAESQAARGWWARPAASFVLVGLAPAALAAAVAVYWWRKRPKSGPAAADPGGAPDRGGGKG